MTEIKICDRSRSLEVSKKFYEKASRYACSVTVTLECPSILLSV